MECVSNVAHMFQEHIDTVKLATETHERNFNKPTSKYYQMTVDDILASWQKISSDACSHGTERHEFGESAFYYMVGEYDKILPEFKDRLTDDGGFLAIHPKEEAVVKFYEEIPQCIVPILAETRVYVEYDKAGYAGTFDILFYYDAELIGKSANDSGLMVLDWKTILSLSRSIIRHLTRSRSSRQHTRRVWMLSSRRLRSYIIAMLSSEHRYRQALVRHTSRTSCRRRLRLRSIRSRCSALMASL